MIAIYVTKSWVEGIGNAADLIVVGSDGEHRIVMAAEKNLDISGAFVEADALRHPSTLAKGKKPFIPVKIPTGEVSAIFDFTEADAKRIGFASS